MEHDSLPGDHPETERVSTGVLPPDTDLQALISAGYERYRHLDEGAVADYIPVLAAASPTAFGVCVAGVGGRLFSVGDARSGPSPDAVPSVPFEIEDDPQLVRIAVAAGDEELAEHTLSKPSGAVRSTPSYAISSTSSASTPGSR